MNRLNSSEFIYLTDTHLGADPIGYYQQYSYNKSFTEIIAALKTWIIDNGNIDFILHGGDIIDQTSEANIDLAKKEFSDLPVPLYLCLGNHDLTAINSLNTWLVNAENFFMDNKPCFCLENDLYAVHVMPSYWCETPYYWDREEQNVNFSDEQIQSLEKNLLKYSDKKVQILLTHSPVFGLSAEQTGFDEPYHETKEKYVDIILEIVKRHSSLKVVLGAHNHMNMHLQRSNTHFVTASSFSETPFEFKHFKINENGISMSTISLLKNINFIADYDFNKTYVQGRPCDRAFEEMF